MSKKIWTSVGTDPEYFIVNARNGKPISSLDIIPGSKQEPHDLKDLGDGYSIQKDNVLVEFCVPPIINDGGINEGHAMELWNRVYTAMRYTQEKILPKDYMLYPATCMEYSADQLDNEYAKTFGCSSSINAWTTDTFIVKNDPDNKHRGAGFHIHIGYNDPDVVTTLQLVKLLDIFVGVPNMLKRREREENSIRRKQYGRAGDFRLTPWGGFEYRVLGSGAIQNEMDMASTFSGIKLAFDYFNNGFEISEKLALDTQICINTCRKSMVSGIMESVGVDIN